MSQFKGQHLLKHLRVPHAGYLTPTTADVRFTEQPLHTAPDWQIVSLRLAGLIGWRAELRITVSDAEGFLYLGTNGGNDLGFVDASDGSVILGIADDLRAHRIDKDIVIEVKFFSQDGVIHIGTADNMLRPRHLATEARSFVIKQVIANDRLPRDSRPKLTILDVGAAGGVDDIWTRFVEDVHFILVEPDPIAALLLQEQTCDIPSVEIINVGLAGEDRSRSLNTTRFPYCSSLLEPDPNIVERYRVAPAFEVLGSIEVECRRYESLHRAGAPTPHYIKLDTQGAELEILQGFGDMLHECLGIQLEAHFYRIYKDQPVIGDLVDYLDTFGLRLRDLRPCRSFDADLVEVDCVFIRACDSNTTTETRERIDFIEEVLRLGGFRLYTDEAGGNVARGLRAASSSGSSFSNSSMITSDGIR